MSDRLTHPENKNAVIYLSNAHKSFCSLSANQMIEVSTDFIRKNAVYGVEVLCSYSKNAIPNDRIQDWAMASLNCMNEIFEGSLLALATTHFDESNPHLHIVYIPHAIDFKGRRTLNFKAYIDGPKDMRKMQTKYADAMAEFGLQRGKENSPAFHSTLKEFRADQIDKAFQLKAYEDKYGKSQEWNLEEYEAFRDEVKKKKKETISNHECENISHNNDVNHI